MCGQIAELRQACQAKRTDVVVMDTNSLTPAQGQKLAKMLGTRVMDRYRLILEIFAQRAQSEESRLQVRIPTPTAVKVHVGRRDVSSSAGAPSMQVELAGLAYKSVHLKSAMESKHLAQQRGGGAFLSGAGETNLEVER
jgi:50S ribosomal subunit-associated GTPase HflX